MKMFFNPASWAGILEQRRLFWQEGTSEPCSLGVPCLEAFLEVLTPLPVVLTLIGEPEENKAVRGIGEWRLLKEP